MPFSVLNDPNQLRLFLVLFVKDREQPEIRGLHNVHLSPQHSCFHTGMHVHNCSSLHL